MPDSIEITVARLDERFNSFEEIISRLAEDQRGLSKAYAELVAQGARFSIIERDVGELKAANKKLWGEFHDTQRQRTRAMEFILAKGFQWIGLMAIGAIAAHFGVKLLL